MKERCAKHSLNRHDEHTILSGGFWFLLILYDGPLKVPRKRCSSTTSCQYTSKPQSWFHANRLVRPLRVLEKQNDPSYSSPIALVAQKTSPPTAHSSIDQLMQEAQPRSRGRSPIEKRVQFYAGFSLDSAQHLDNTKKGFSSFFSKALFRRTSHRSRRVFTSQGPWKNDPSFSSPPQNSFLNESNEFRCNITSIADEVWSGVAEKWKIFHVSRSNLIKHI